MSPSTGSALILNLREFSAVDFAAVVEEGSRSVRIAKRKYLRGGKLLTTTAGLFRSAKLNFIVRSKGRRQSSASLRLGGEPVTQVLGRTLARRSCRVATSWRVNTF